MTSKDLASLFWALGRLGAPIKWRASKPFKTFDHFILSVHSLISHLFLPPVQVLCALIDHFKTLIPFARGGELAAFIHALPVVARYPSPQQIVKQRKYVLVVSSFVGLIMRKC